VHRHQPAQWVNGLASIAAALTIAGWLLAVPAYPTSYVASAVPYTVDSIVHGSALYAQRCGACHGPHGGGDGPAASSLAIKPANLVEHSAHHHPGDLFWWIAHGIPGTPMQGFASQLSDVDIWDLIQFLHAQADSDEAMAMTDRVEPWRPIVAPDFTFEISGGPQESLKQQRGRHVTLLVLYTLPQSLRRLGVLATAHHAFEEVGVRVIAVPFGTFSTSVNAGAAKDDNAIFAIVNANVATAYTLFARQVVASSSATSAHTEFLIDRQGYLRARWIGVPDTAADRMAETHSQIELLNRERPHAPVSERHAH